MSGFQCLLIIIIFKNILKHIEPGKTILFNKAWWIGYSFKNFKKAENFGTFIKYIILNKNI